MRSVLRDAAQTVAEGVFLTVLIALWPILHVVSLARPSPYPPWLTQLLEGPIRRAWLNRDRCLAESGLSRGMHALEVGPGGGYARQYSVEPLEAQALLRSALAGGAMACVGALFPIVRVCGVEPALVFRQGE
jgi:hypothetical protein